MACGQDIDQGRRSISLYDCCLSKSQNQKLIYFINAFMLDIDPHGLFTDDIDCREMERTQSSAFNEINKVTWLEVSGLRRLLTTSLSN